MRGSAETLELLAKDRTDALERVDAARRQVELEYMKRARRLESRRGAIRERRGLLMRIKDMPVEVAREAKAGGRIAREDR